MAAAALRDTTLDYPSKHHHVYHPPMALIETTKRGKTIWRVRWNYRDRSIDGKPYDEREFRTLKAAKDWDKKVSRDPAIVSGTLTVAQVCKRFLDGPVSELPVSTQRDYEQVFRLHVIPGIGRKKADRLSANETSNWRDKLRSTGFDALGPERAEGDKRPRAKRPARPVSAPTVNKVIRITRSAFRWGRSQGITSSRVFDDLLGIRDRRPREEKRDEAYAYTPQEIDALVAACPTLMERTIILFTKDSGLRRGELFALCWDSLDLKDGVVYVRRALDADGSFKEPKTYERREVAILEDGLQAIREWAEVARPKRLTKKPQPVFHNEDGSLLHTNWTSGYAGQMKKKPDGTKILTDGIRKRSGVWLRLSELRDTFASTIILAGATDLEVSVSVGHRSVETTRRHYFRWLKVSQDSLRDRANAKIRELRKLVAEAG